MIELAAPVVLAPLAGGPSTPELAAAVSNAGGLGFLAAGYLAPEELAARLRRTRELTSRPVGVNVFVLEKQPFDEAAVAAYAAELAGEGPLGEPHFDDDALAEKLELLVAEPPAVVSLTFGCLPAAEMARLRRAGSEVWATVTTAAEARAAAEAGADALVCQGAEAGGHRGSWDDADGPDLAVADLLAAVGVDVSLPLVAAGGVMDARAVGSALAAGAAAVQCGSAFLLSPEAGTAAPHRAALARSGETAVTRAFTGRRARGIVNAFMRAHPDAPAAYPYVHHLTAPLRAAARAAGDAERINLWAGTGFAAARPEPAADVVARLAA